MTSSDLCNRLHLVEQGLVVVVIEVIRTKIKRYLVCERCG